MKTKTEEPKNEEETLASAIRKISAATTALSRQGLNRKAIVALVHDYGKVGKGTIESVLDSLEALEKQYCK